MSDVMQREWVSVVKTAISEYVAQGCREGDYAVDGYTVMVGGDGQSQLPDGRYKIGLYLPGSTPDGACDHYAVCTADGEEI